MKKATVGGAARRASSPDVSGKAMREREGKVVDAANESWAVEVEPERERERMREGEGVRGREGGWRSFPSFVSELGFSIYFFTYLCAAPLASCNRIPLSGDIP